MTFPVGRVLQCGALVLLALWAIFLRPTSFGGSASYVVVSGTSMEPTLRGGDLAILARADAYADGDVVAFRTDSGNVIHRIVAGDAGGYETRGDNREGSDLWRPTAAEIAGRLWFQVPGGGSWLDFFREPNRMAALLGVFGFVTVAGLRPRPRRRARTARVPLGNLGLGRPAVVALVLAAAAFAIGLLVGFAAFVGTPQPAPAATRLRYEHAGTLDYVVKTKPSVVYPGESVAAAQPVYTRLVRTIEGTFRYTLASADAANVSGEHRLDLVISAPEGWSRRSELAPVARFEGQTAQTSWTIDVQQILDTIGAVERETGVQTGTYDLTLTPSVTIRGRIADDDITAAFAPSYTFKFSRTLIRPPAALEQRDPVMARGTVREPSARIMGLELPLGTARGLSVGLLAGGLLLAFVVLGSAGLGLRRSETRFIGVRYGGLLVSVTEADPAPHVRRVRVASIGDLVRLAKRGSGTVLHQERASGEHVYSMHEDGVVYEYTASSREAEGVAG